ncbi:MAG: TolC family protein [Bacteroidetes bacterium]|nr:MAG: TolC family protein [Bacteroidota bacterium]
MKNTFFVTLFLVASTSVWGQEKAGYNLLEAQETALNNSEKLKQSVLDEEIARLKVVETRAIGLPQASLSGNFQNFLNLPIQVVDASFINPNAKPGETISFRAGTDYSASGTFQANQLLFNGSYLVGLQVSKFYQDFAKTNSEKTKEDVLFNVTQAYQMAVVAKENQLFMDSIVLATKNLVDKQQNYFELGLMVQEDMDQLNFALSNAQNSQESARLQYQNALALLKMTMGLEQSVDLEPTEDIRTLLKRSASLSGEQTVQSNINYVLLQKQIQLNEYNLKNKRMAYLPTASAFFQQTYNAYRNEFNFFANEKWFPQTLWGLQLQIPLFSSGSRKSQVSQARVELEKSRTQLTELEKALQMQKIQYENNLKSALSQLALQQKNVELAKTIYQNSITKKEIGKESSIVVSQKYNQLVMAQAQYVGAMLEVFNSKLNLDKLYHHIQ